MDGWVQVAGVRERKQEDIWRHGSRRATPCPCWLLHRQIRLWVERWRRPSLSLGGRGSVPRRLVHRFLPDTLDATLLILLYQLIAGSLMDPSSVIRIIILPRTALPLS